MAPLKTITSYIYKTVNFKKNLMLAILKFIKINSLCLVDLQKRNIQNTFTRSDINISSILEVTMLFFKVQNTGETYNGAEFDFILFDIFKI